MLHNATKAKGSSFFLSRLQCYLDIGDTIVFSHRVHIPRLAPVTSNVGTILRAEKQTNLDAENILYCRNRYIYPSDTQWIQVNWWISPQLSMYTQPNPYTHVILPTKLMHKNFIQWIQSLYINNICCILHINNVLHEKYVNTHGMKNVYYSQLIFDASTNNQHICAASLHIFLKFLEEVN